MLLAAAAQAINIDFVPVGDAHNDADADTGFGRVDYDYNIGKYDVTAKEYCEFLNAVAKVSDTYGLYNTKMNVAVNGEGCNIVRSLQAGKYTYNVADDWANRPVNFVSWGDAARFCNWLQNGQKIGNEDASTTETGTYALNGANTDALLSAVTRNPSAKYFIPSLDESYKAAYFDPNKNGPGIAGYWNFPTKHDTMPSNVLDPLGTNNGNFYDVYGTGNHDYTIGDPYWRTEVGTFVSSPSPYGTYDQGANVAAWDETSTGDLYRNGYGGSFVSTCAMGKGVWGGGAHPTYEASGIGFRVGSASIPEPNSLLLLLLGIVGGIFWRQWNK